MEWKKLSTLQKIWIVIASIAALFLAVSLRDKEMLLSSIIAVLTLSEAVLYWNERRKIAYLMIAAAVISMVCLGIELLL